ncbi:DNA repair protein endonuclease SAE2/CtIP C-terminus-domain-containing protein [Phyllosticta capitalensis]
MEKNNNFSQESDGVSTFVAGLTGTLEQNIRDEMNKQKHRVRVVERHNSSLLVRIDELEEENKRLNEKLASALQSRSDVQSYQQLAGNQEALPSPAIDCSTTAPSADRSKPVQVSPDAWSELNRKYEKLQKQDAQRVIAMGRLEAKSRRYKDLAKEWEQYARKNMKAKSSGHRYSDFRGPSTPISVMSPMPEREGLADMVTESRQASTTDQIHLMPPVHNRLQKRPATSSDDTRNQEPVSAPALERVLEESGERSDPPSSVTEHGVNNFETPRQNPHDRIEALDRREQGSTEPRSSQTTQEEDYEQAQQRLPGAQSQASDGDEPQFISERTLKRKHRGVQEGLDFTVFKDDQNALELKPAEAVHIKTEPEESQSVPVSQILASHFPTGQSLDLDDTGNQLHTPRKRRQFEKPSNRHLTKRKIPRDVPILRQERSFSAPAELNPLFPRHVRTGREQFTIKAEQSHGFDPLHIASEDEENSGEGTGPHPSPRNHRNTNPLGQVDANSRVPFPQPQFRPRPAKKRGEESRGAKAIHLVSESGEDGAPESEMSPEMREESRRRLAGLLDTDRSPEKRSIAKPLTPATNRTARSAHKASSSKKTPHTEPIPKKPLITTPQTASKVPQRTSKRLLDRNHQSLRSRPLEQLGINDFKINPNVNDGVAFAYNQVIRNQEARRCIPGCIKEECCGPTFRALVESGIDPPPIQEELWASSQTELTDDDKFLGAYLGSTYNKEAFGLKPWAEQREILTKAKMTAWANCCGRHRHTFQRERTPPGFWRADFPGTQEAQKDREAARKEERRLVEERWREAMTEGGRWLFRDE